MIDRSFNESYIPVEINAGNGTQGIFIDQGFIKVHDPLSGGFYGMFSPLHLASPRPELVGENCMFRCGLSMSPPANYQASS